MVHPVVPQDLLDRTAPVPGNVPIGTAVSGGQEAPRFREPRAAPGRFAGRPVGWTAS